MIEVIILAIALSMDAFAVAIGLGAKHNKKTTHLALLAAIYFGLFQALMPLIGFLGGRGLLGWVDGYAHMIAFVLLIIIGGKMLFEALSEGIEEDIAQITHKVMLFLAIATSIDAMAAGFSLNLLAVNAFVACFIIGLITAVFSALGVFLGAKSGNQWEKKAEIFGGVVLCLMAFKLLLF